MDSTDSGTPSSKERIGAKEARRARQQVGAGAQQGPQAGRAARPRGEGPGTGPGPGRDEGRGAAGAVPPLQGRPGRRGGRGAAVGAGHRRGDRPEGDRVGAAGAGVPVLRDGDVRGAAARRCTRARCPTGRC